MIKPRYWWTGSDLLSAFFLQSYQNACRYVKIKHPQMLRSCSSPSQKSFADPQACRSTRRWRFFRYTDAKKYYLLVDCLDRLCLAGYNQSGDGRAACVILFRSHPARRRGYGPAGRTCSVQVGRVEGIKPHYHECCQSSYPRQSMQVLWLLLQLQHFVSFHAWLICSIYSEVWC